MKLLTRWVLRLPFEDPGDFCDRVVAWDLDCFADLWERCTNPVERALLLCAPSDSWRLIRLRAVFVLAALAEPKWRLHLDFGTEDWRSAWAWLEGLLAHGMVDEGMFRRLSVQEENSVFGTISTKSLLNRAGGKLLDELRRPDRTSNPADGIRYAVGALYDSTPVSALCAVMLKDGASPEALCRVLSATCLRAADRLAPGTKRKEEALPDVIVLAGKDGP